MIINEIRIYAEVLEQGLDFKEYIQKAGFEGNVINVYTKKGRGEFVQQDSLVDRIRKVKDVDVLITSMVSGQEYPILMVEYSTAVPTDDHKMQRSDVYYWSALFKVPMLKISPSTKGMGQDFGGGDRITDAQEQVLSYSRGAIFYPINWDSKTGIDILPTKESALSCLPENEKLAEIISLLITTFTASNDYDAFYKSLLEDYSRFYSEIFSGTSLRSIRENITNSTRFHWYGEKLCVKINRFGHAMDPDRGVLYFANMLVGAQNTVAEIQVNRPKDLACRGGYNALFDALAKKKMLLSYVTKLIQTQNNCFTDDNAIYILMHALNIENALSLKKEGEHQYIIEDDVLKHFLLTHSSIVSKTIFFLTTNLILTDKDRNTICSIRWNTSPIEEYLTHINTCNYTPTIINPLTIQEAKEDVVTFASVELYKRLHCELLATSYPGAQGDRCILTGAGRSVLRTYVDIIAYRRTPDGIEVFLEECKDTFSKSASDVEKLNEIVKSQGKSEGLRLLFDKILQQSNINEIYTAVAAKYSKSMPQFMVDYIFMFSLSSDARHTYIDYTVAVVNTNLIPLFSPLANNGRLIGRLTYDMIYILSDR